MGNTEKLFDLTSLKEMLEDDDTALNMMLSKFVEVSPRLLDEINSSFANKDLEKVRNLAHQMKPSIDILNITELQSEIRLIEKDTLDKDKMEELRQLISKLNDIYTEVLSQNCFSKSGV